jgi:hypothetical protein
MNPTETEAHLIGGPIAGNSITRTSGTWPAYLDDTGHRLATTTGDREFARIRRGQPGRRYYMFQRHAGKPVYVHLTETAPNSVGDTDQQRPLSFRQWLRQHRNEQSPVGDLARDAIADDTWPRGPGSLQRYETHLKSRHACEDALNALRDAWGRYETRQ